MDERETPQTPDGATAARRATAAEVDVRVGIGPPARVIAAAAHEHGVEAIAMATHGRGGLTRLVLGSVATGVVQQARMPLLLVRPSAQRSLDDVAAGKGAAVVGEPPRERSITLL